ncbi:phage tail protein, partial [Escherichia coli]|nr:phage tail protein [Escherichia coli]EFF3887133.1 phage tail protein [Escherichia coli]EFF3887138.1 phage tail protein [Escherichia coli]
MSGKQYQGTATIRVNGQEYDTLEGATFSPSGFEREVVKGAKVYGYRQKPREATLDCKFPAGGEGSPAADEINNWTAVTIEFVADTGEVHMMT